jgi:hypothetical protein
MIVEMVFAAERFGGILPDLSGSQSLREATGRAGAASVNMPASITRTQFTAGERSLANNVADRSMSPHHSAVSSTIVPALQNEIARKLVGASEG